MWSWRLKGCKSALAVKGASAQLSGSEESDGNAMLMSPNKDETAVHGCHCRGDMAARMRKYCRPRGWCWSVSLAFFVFHFKKMHDMVGLQKLQNTLGDSVDGFRLRDRTNQRGEDLDLTTLTGGAGLAQCQSIRLPPIWRHKWAEFVGSLLFSERFFPGYSGFPLSSKTNI